MKWLKNFRSSKRMTLEEMANSIGISKSLYEKLEYGEREPSTNFIKKFMIAYPETDANVFFDNQLHVKCSEGGV